VNNHTGHHGEQPVEIRRIGGLVTDLGEGPSWDPSLSVLRFVDITKRTLHRYDPADGTTNSIELPQEVSAVIPRRRGGLVVAARDGIAAVDEEQRTFELLVPIESELLGNRMNDAKCDPAGRLWAGSMAFDVASGAGAFYRIQPDLTVERMVSDVTESNGLDWSPDTKTMYYVDSMEYGLDAFDFDLETGRIGRRRRLVTIQPDTGIPDGVTVDAEGHIWVAIWGEGAIRRYTPDGALERRITLPASQVTNMTFGGADYGDLYITTAQVGLTPEQLEAEPLAGSTFVCRPGVQGRPSHAFDG